MQIAASVGGDTVPENLDLTVHNIVFGQKLFRFQSDIDVFKFCGIAGSSGCECIHMQKWWRK